MEEKSELNDIILNKSSKSNTMQKVLLSVATFSIILIIVVVIMNRFSSNDEMALPHAPRMAAVAVEEVVPEPDPLDKAEAVAAEDPNESAVEEETVVADSRPAVERIEGQDLETSTFEEPQIIREPVYEKAPEKGVEAAPSVKAVPVVKEATKTVKKPAVQKVQKTAAKPKVETPSGKYDPKSKKVVYPDQPAASKAGHYYIQVGSFARQAPSEKFLHTITERGYTYTFHKVRQNGRTLTKVLVGPFRTESAAREALPVIKKRVISTAFLIKI